MVKNLLQLVNFYAIMGVENVKSKLV